MRARSESFTGCCTKFEFATLSEIYNEDDYLIHSLRTKLLWKVITTEKFEMKEEIKRGLGNDVRKGCKRSREIKMRKHRDEERRKSKRIRVRFSYSSHSSFDYWFLFGICLRSIAFFRREVVIVFKRKLPQACQQHFLEFVSKRLES